MSLLQPMMSWPRNTVRAMGSAVVSGPRTSARMKAMEVTIIVGPKCAAVAYARSFIIVVRRFLVTLSCPEVMLLE